jgi:hypothetical protein
MDGKRSSANFNQYSNHNSTGNLINFSNYNNYNFGKNNFSNFSSFPPVNPNNNSQIGEYFECNDEFNYCDNFSNRDLSKKTLNPKFMEKNNTLTRLSTNESNDSFDSVNPNQFFTGSNTPVCVRNYSQTPINMMHYPHGKKINFNNYGGYPAGVNNFPSNNNFSANNNFSGNNFSSIPPSGYYPKSSFLPSHDNNNPNSLNNNFQMNPCQTQQKINFQNLPENAFSFNIDNQIGSLNLNNPNQHVINNNNNINKSYSDKKKIKKSKDEVDQTLFIINTHNIIEGKDRRTTVMIRHIPNKYSTQSLLEEVNINFRGKFDFFYLPMDFQVCFLKIKIYK